MSSTPMDEMIDFLTGIRDRIDGTIKDHWAWFHDENTRIRPDEHYRRVDDTIIALAHYMNNYVEGINLERKAEAERVAREVAESQYPDEDPDYDCNMGGFEDEEPNPYSGTYSEE